MYIAGRVWYRILMDITLPSAPSGHFWRIRGIGAGGSWPALQLVRRGLFGVTHVVRAINLNQVDRAAPFVTWNTISAELLERAAGQLLTQHQTELYNAQARAQLDGWTSS